MTQINLVWLSGIHRGLSWLALFALFMSVVLSVRNTKKIPPESPLGQAPQTTAKVVGAAPQTTAKIAPNRLFHRFLTVTALLHVAAFVSGVLLHPSFQNKLRQKLFLMNATLGWLFERKEHVAFAAVSFVLCGFFANFSVQNMVSAPLQKGQPPNTELSAQGVDQTRRRLFRVVQVSLFFALLLTIFALIVSLFAARHVRF